MMLPMDNLALWNAVEGPDRIYLSQLAAWNVFYPDAPPPAGAAVGLCTMVTWARSGDGTMTTHPFICGRVAAPDHHGRLYCQLHQHNLYECQCCQAWLGDSLEHYCAACQDGACGEQCGSEVDE